MSDQAGSSNNNNAENKPFPRLSSFKLPRDLTLGAGTTGPPKTNKKLFTPNLNVVRNKNKQVAPNIQSNNKREERNKREKQNNRNKHTGPAVVKSSGVFSEGIAASEKPSSRGSFTRDSDATPALQKPVLRQKNFAKIDKELEEQKIKKALGSSHHNASSDDDDDGSLVGARDAPIRLPISAGVGSEKVEKFIPEVGVSAFDSTDIVRLLTGDKPKMMLLQLPDNLPGRGKEEDSPPHKKKPGPSTEEEPKVVDNICRLSDLEEGRIGKIQIYKSGKVKLRLGDTLFDLSLGTQPCFRQDVVSVAVDSECKTGTMINLGGIEKKLNIIPDWETLFKDVVI